LNVELVGGTNKGSFCSSVLVIALDFFDRAIRHGVSEDMFSILCTNDDEDSFKSMIFILLNIEPAFALELDRRSDTKFFT
jgi:hypothetical protein